MFGVVAIAASVAALTLAAAAAAQQGPLHLRDCRWTRGKVGEAVNFSSLVCRVAQAACKRWE